MVPGSPLVPELISFSLQLELSCGELDVTRGTTDEWSVIAEHGPENQPAIDGSSASLSLTQGGSPSGFLAFTEERRTDWTVSLPVGAELSAGMTLNAATGAVDLGGGDVAEFGATLNASDVTLDLGEATTTQVIDLGLTFNASSGRLTLPAGSVTGGMTLNVSSLTICTPASSEVRIELESTLLSSNDFGESGLTEVGGAWQTEGFGTAASRIDLSITSTLSSITLERPEVCQ
jgi:hypothetical protein